MKGGQNRKAPESRQSARVYTADPANAPPIAPDILSEGAKTAFTDLVSLLPENVPARSDSLALGILATLLDEFWQNPAGFPNARLNPLRGLLAEFGLTLASRQRLDVKAPAPPNPFASVARR
jgi:hypothetical protein